MKCPKCGYLGFESVNRCRNCGYDFSLARTDDQIDPDLPIRRETNRVELHHDLSLAAEGGLQSEEALAGSIARRGVGVGVSVSPKRVVTDLPLFGSRVDDGEPLITKASPPRPPLAVRRATPEVPRVRAEQPRMQLFDPSLDADEKPPISVADRLLHHFELPGADASVVLRRDAAVSARIVAVVIDVLILAAIDAIVIYFTMKICGVTFDEVGILPKIPLIAFLLVQNGGYLVAFTMGGQTLGKMAVDIRVVSDDSDDALDLGRAFARTAVWVLLALPAGLGFLTALFSHDRRALHDRFAGTRVVRASA